VAHPIRVGGHDTIRTFDAYADDARVQDAGIVIAPALGFYGALGDLLATVAMGGWPSADEISIAVALDSWKPTRGTLLAGENTAGRRVVLAGHRVQICVPSRSSTCRSRHCDPPRVAASSLVPRPRAGSRTTL